MNAGVLTVKDSEETLPRKSARDSTGFKQTRWPPNYILNNVVARDAGRELHKRLLDCYNFPRFPLITANVIKLVLKYILLIIFPPCFFRYLTVMALYYVPSYIIACQECDSLQMMPLKFCTQCSPEKPGA